MIDESDARSSARTVRALAGVLATVAWLALWTFAIWGDHAAAAALGRAATLTLNEWSTLAAAIVAPIGVLWLVLGYFQQAEALARNTAALRAQQRALSSQVEETAALVREHARQAAAAATLAELELAAHRRHEDARRAALAPELRFADAKFSAAHGVATLAMVNAGGTAYGLRFHSEDFAEGRFKPAEVVERNAAFNLQLSLGPMLRRDGGAFAIRCRDVEGREHAFAFRAADGAVLPEALALKRRATEPVER